MSAERWSGISSPTECFNEWDWREGGERQAGKLLRIQEYFRRE